MSAAGPEGAAPDEWRDLTRRFWIGAALALPVFLLAMARLLPAQSARPWWEGDPSRWAQFALAAPVVGWAGCPFFVRGWHSIRTGHLNMFTLISIGVSAAFIFSAVAMLGPGVFPSAMRHDGRIPIYFEAAAVIIVLVLLGQVLELRSRSRTGSAITALLNLTPPLARQVAPGGDLRGIAQGIHLSRATLRNIRQNLWFAFLYNAVGIPLAAGALYPHFGLLLSPMIAGAAMSLSSVSVIGNALRLRRVNL
jgi:cation transport ATPase